MQPTDATATRYDRATIAIHWLMALLVVCQFLGAQVIDDFPKGPLRVDARSVHLVGGVAVANQSKEGRKGTLDLEVPAVALSQVAAGALSLYFFQRTLAL